MDPRAFRLLAGGLAAAIMVSGPAAFAVCGRTWSASPPWRMFEHAGLGHCDVRFEAGGRPLDRYAPFGARGRLDAPDEIVDIVDAERAASMAATLCAGTDAPSVRVAMRCASPDGWDTKPPLEVACR